MSERGNIGQFAIKAVIVSITIILTLWAALAIMDNFVEARLEASGKIGGRQFWAKIERELEKQADPKSDLSPEKKQKLLAQIRTVADRWHPFIREVMSAASQDEKNPAKQ